MFENFDLNRIVVMFVPLIFAVTVHEVAHGYVAWLMGDATAKNAGRLSLNPIRHIDPVGSVIVPLILALSPSGIVFGWAKPVPVNFYNLRDQRMGTLFVASAGVFANLILAVLSAMVFRLIVYFQAAWYDSAISFLFVDLYQILGYSVIINCVLLIFNLIPVPPLDGSRILAMFLPENLRVQYEKIERYGMIILIFLLFTNTIGKIIFVFLVPMRKLLLGQ